MKISDRTFPYPVLSQANKDYEESEFTAACRISNQSLNSVELSFDLSLSCPDLQRLIEEGKAEYVIHIECPATSYREILRRREPVFVHGIQLSKLRGSVECTALVTAAEAIEGYSSADFTADFRTLSFAIPNGGILAYSALPAVKVEAPVIAAEGGHSVVIVYKRDKTGDAPMTVEINSDTINIGLGCTDYDNFVKMSSERMLQPLLNGMIVLPALVYALDQLQDPDVLASCEEREWYKTLSESMKVRGMDLKKLLLSQDSTDNEPPSTIEIAQELMRNPLQTAFRSIEQLDSEEET